ncbi:hypothetical protein EJB05_41834, partial [Eragrostis curvula]
LNYFPSPPPSLPPSLPCSSQSQAGSTSPRVSSSPPASKHPLYSRAAAAAAYPPRRPPQLSYRPPRHLDCPFGSSPASPSRGYLWCYVVATCGVTCGATWLLVVLRGCDLQGLSGHKSCIVFHDSACMIMILKATNENLPPNVIRQLAKELKNLDESPPEGITVIVNDDDFTNICADIEGPAGTPYENGVFRMKLLLSHDFPQSPPKGFFLTKIFHPNIATSGEICVNTLKKDWNPGLGLRHVLLVVRCLLIEPFPESALNEQAGKMLLENYEEYARHARLYTGIHALKPKNKSKSGAISESTTALNVDQSSAAFSENAPSAPTAALPTSSATRTFGTNLQDQNATVSDPAVGASATRKKDGPMASKIPVDKKKMDARKKSLKRL